MMPFKVNRVQKSVLMNDTERHFGSLIATRSPALRLYRDPLLQSEIYTPPRAPHPHHHLWFNLNV